MDIMNYDEEIINYIFKKYNTMNLDLINYEICIMDYIDMCYSNLVNENILSIIYI